MMSKITDAERINTYFKKYFYLYVMLTLCNLIFSILFLFLYNFNIQIIFPQILYLPWGLSIFSFGFVIFIILFHLKTDWKLRSLGWNNEIKKEELKVFWDDFNKVYRFMLSTILISSFNIGFTLYLYSPEEQIEYLLAMNLLFLLYVVIIIGFTSAISGYLLYLYKRKYVKRNKNI